MVRFSDFELDMSRRKLTREGTDLHLTPKAFDLLAVLVEAAPRVVRKAELHDRLWPGGVVSDATLIGLVKEVRRALSIPGKSGSLIRTVHRVGYALETPVTRETEPRSARWLIVQQSRIPLAEGENIIGRDPQANVWLDYSTVSRRHARIVVSGPHVTLEDLGSKNGTSVGGVWLAGVTTLRDGDCFACGRVSITYRESSAELPTATQVSHIGTTHYRR